MHKLSKKEKILAVAFGTLLFIFLLEKGILSPFLNKLEAITSQMKVETRRLTKLVYIDSQKANIIKDFGEIKSYIEIGKTEDDALAVIMKKIEEMAKEHEIVLLNMKPEAESEQIDHEYKSRKITLSIEGSQRNLITFFYKLENSLYPISINKLDFSVEDRDKGYMEADLAVYFIYFL